MNCVCFPVKVRASSATNSLCAFAGSREEEQARVSRDSSWCEKLKSVNRQEKGIFRRISSEGREECPDKRKELGKCWALVEWVCRMLSELTWLRPSLPV